MQVSFTQGLPQLWRLQQQGSFPGFLEVVQGHSCLKSGLQHICISAPVAALLYTESSNIGLTS